LGDRYKAVYRFQKKKTNKQNSQEKKIIIIRNFGLNRNGRTLLACPTGKSFAKKDLSPNDNDINLKPEQEAAIRV